MCPRRCSAPVVCAVSAFLITTILAASIHASMIKVMPLGDSVTGCGTATHDGEFRYPLWNLIEAGPLAGPIDFVGTAQKGPFTNSLDRDHEGHSGNTVAETASNPGDGTTIEGWLVSTTPDVILLHIGTVNAFHTNPSNPLDTITTLEELVDRIFLAQPNVKLFLASMIGTADDQSSPFSTYVSDYNAAIPALVTAELAQGNDITFIDLVNGAGLIYGIGSSDFFDMVRPNDVGYDKMAALWYNTVSLSSTPEPATLAILVMGIALFLARRQARHPS